MYENLSQISDEVAVELRRFAITLARTELIEWGDLSVLLDKKSGELAPLVGSVATLFIESVKGDVGRVGEDPVPVHEPIPEVPKAAAVLQDLEPRYRAAREARPEDFPLSGGAKRFLGGLLGINNSYFWHRLGLNGQQAEVFGETVIVDHAHFRKYDVKDTKMQDEGIRLYLAGYDDRQIMEAKGFVSIQAVRQGRARFKKRLLKNYAEGKDTACRRFARCLTLAQLEVLKAEFPGAFKDELNAEGKNASLVS